MTAYLIAFLALIVAVHIVCSLFPQWEDKQIERMEGRRDVGQQRQDHS